MVIPIKATFIMDFSVDKANLHGLMALFTLESLMIIASQEKVPINGQTEVVMKATSKMGSDMVLVSILSMRQPIKVTGSMAKNKEKERLFSRVEVSLKVISKTI